VKPFAELSSSLALARQVLAGTRPPRTKEMDGLKLTDMQWESIVDAWDQDPTRRPVLSSGGEPMISSWKPETEVVHDVSHQPDLDAEEALEALKSSRHRSSTWLALSGQSSTSSRPSFD
jgi:hypothetical protein